MKLNNFREKTAPWLPKLMMLLCVLQPILDVASFWLNACQVSNATTTALRMVMLAAVAGLGFLLSEKKWIYGIMGLLLALLTAGHIWACSQWGYDAPAEDLANLLRIYQLPLMTLAFMTFQTRNKACMASVRRGFFWCLLICGAVELLSLVTGTNPYTYPNKSVGLLGWFYFANSQSAVLSVLVPVALVYALRRWPDTGWQLALTAILGTAVLYLLATRLAYVSMLAVLVGLALCLLLLGKLQKESVKKPVAILLVCAMVAAAGYAVSPMVKNGQMVAHNKILKQQDIDARVAADDAAAVADGLEGEALEIARLASAYETYLTGPTGRFGLERTAKWYGYSTDAGDIADVRREKLTYNEMLLEDCPGGSFWFGMEREDMAFGGEYYDVENDFHGMFYLTGMAGLLLCLAFLGYFFLRILLALIRRFRETFTPEAVGCGLALCCILVHAYFTSGVLRRPNVNFYLAMLLAMAYGLTVQKKKETKK